ncbi:MAG: dihydrodipicolinate synthase family protein [Nitrososphaerota archaeon]|nr:dihydrodipicolinate synthase family protein [Nitrososphaerota archaeon]MDG7027620.1 dihydrodipicolinate synthase family protein [Nitrososphaerota archaeon]MDG7030733.1 dihydrodipicolinate synthase family protein [Nitrososphaerota archaeon]
MPTPFDKNGEVDEGRLRELTDYLIDGGVDGLFPLGTTGEFALLDRRERKRILEVVVDKTNSRVPILAGISDPSPRNAIAYAKDAADVGADGVVATAPYYYRVDEEGLFRHFALIHGGVTLPLVLYNIPEWTHNFVPLSVVSRLAEDEMIVGMKYTEYNMLNLVAFIEAVGQKVAVFTGSDAMAYSCLEAGGKGAVISISNIAPKTSSSIFDLFRNGLRDDALGAQKSLLPLVKAAGTGYFPAGLKAAMGAAGFPVGEVRPPQTPLSELERRKVRELVEKAGLK